MDRNGRKIPQEVKEYIKAHVNERPRSGLAKRLGISYSYLQTLVREYGGEKLLFGAKAAIDDRKVAEMYLSMTMTVSEIAKEMGVSPSTIRKRVVGMQLQKSPQLECRHRQTRLSALKKANTPECRAKATDTMRRTRRMEKWRLMSGLQKKTKLRFRSVPLRVYQALYHLKHKYNYFSLDEAYVLFYDTQTRRCNDEQYYSIRYGIKFVEANEE